MFFDICIVIAYLGMSFVVGQGEHWSPRIERDATFLNLVWTFYPPTLHCAVFILEKETLIQIMMAYDDYDNNDC